MTNCSWLLLKSLQVPLAADGVTTSFCCPNLLFYFLSFSFFKNSATTLSPVIFKMNDGREKYTEGEGSFHDSVKCKGEIIGLES